MRFNLTLSTHSTNSVIPINYQYPFSSFLYKTLGSADCDLASSLHKDGYKVEGSLKQFKLFTFSNLTPFFKIKDDKLVIKGKIVQIKVCFQIKEIAAAFAAGICTTAKIVIADNQCGTDFSVKKLEIEKPWYEEYHFDKIVEVTLEPISPMSIAVYNDKNNLTYLSPENKEFSPALIYHWKEKYSAVYGRERAERDFEKFQVSLHNPDKAFSKLITIKTGKPEEVKIRGFQNFQIIVNAPARVIDLAMNAGIGLHCSQGFGCVRIIE